MTKVKAAVAARKEHVLSSASREFASFCARLTGWRLGDRLGAKRRGNLSLANEQERGLHGAE